MKKSNDDTWSVILFFVGFVLSLLITGLLFYECGERRGEDYTRARIKCTDHNEKYIEHNSKYVVCQSPEGYLILR